MSHFKKMSDLKLKGRRLYLDGKEVAEIRGYREFVRGEPHGQYDVWQGGEKVAPGFCYFKDAVSWVRDILGKNWLEAKS